MEESRVLLNVAELFVMGQGAMQTLPSSLTSGKHIPALKHCVRKKCKTGDSCSNVASSLQEV